MWAWMGMSRRDDSSQAVVAVSVGAVASAAVFADVVTERSTRVDSATLWITNAGVATTRYWIG